MTQQHGPLADYRDGTSQTGRVSAALDPDYVAVDERSLKDLLAFAQAYAKELRYFPHENNDQLEAQGDWQGFLGEDLDLDEVVAFIETPENFSLAQYPHYYRPHFLLFLTYLQLLRLVQADLNQLTRRHLDFYYQQVLQLTKKAAIPDQVNVLVQLANDTKAFELSAGTQLDAGVDSAGDRLVYQTDQTLVFNQAQIAQLSSIYVDKQVIGPREAREGYDGPSNEAFMEMLKLALGHPSPGDPLPLYLTRKQQVDYAFVLSRQRVIDFVQNDLGLDFPDFRVLIRLKQQRDQSDPEWTEINQLLQKAGQTRTGDPNYRLNPENIRDFEQNLNTAMGGPPNYHGLTEVDDIDDLYEQRIRESVQAFIREQLYFTDLNDFNRMMQLKVRSDKEWAEINRLLEMAGQRKGILDPTVEPAYTFPVAKPSEAKAFETNLAAALGSDVYSSLAEYETVETIETIDQYYAAFLAVETYFFMSAENFAYMMTVQTETESEFNGQADSPEATPEAWEKVYTMLAEAHRQKVYAQRQAQLRQIREAQGFEAMINFAAGTAQTQSTLTALQFLAQCLETTEAAFLENLQAREASGSVTEDEWTRGDLLVEKAQRSILASPVAEKEAWLNLYPIEDAMSATVESPLSAETDTPRWKTFGRGQPVVEQASRFGWAISSPVLDLSQGQRRIILTLGFGPEEFLTETIQALFPPPNDARAVEPGPFQIELSTEEGWLEAMQVDVALGDYTTLSGTTSAEDTATDGPNNSLQALQFTITFAENLPAITPLPLEEAQIQSEWPLLRVMLRQLWRPNSANEALGRYISHYQSFKDLQLFRVQVQVDVSGLTPTHLQNDEAALKVGSPFEPFGPTPLVGSRFYLGHPELICKKLDRLEAQIVWMNGPNNLGHHYKNYPDIEQATAPIFTARISLIDGLLDLTLASAASLFDGSTGNEPWTISMPNFATTIEAQRPDYRYQRATKRETADDLLAWNRYLQWELNSPDFQHSNYSAVASQKSLDLSVQLAQAAAVTAADYHVNPPYTPKIKALTLTYTTSIELDLSTYQKGTLDQVFYLHPFGYAEFTERPQSGSQPFLPQYNHQGELYLGLRDVNAKAAQTLSLLFQMGEGSANPDVVLHPVQWHYLSDNQWQSLENGNLLQDGTRGFINSGILIFSLPPAQANTLLDPDLYWLRASIAQNSDGVCDTVAIHSQAISATFVDQNNAPDHLSQPLSAESITDLVEREAGVAAIEQPYTSFRGKVPEADENFYTRISERLRHKNRALTVWDYEHLILEAFPQIYKVKCLPSTTQNLGQVDIIVIPDIKNKLPFNPFEPKVPADLMADIETFLDDKMPPFATVQVKNATYVTIKVRFGVQFRVDYNLGYYKQQLNEDLNRFLSPWAYEEGADLVIGGRIYANVIINFIEERDYVDYVAQVKFFSSDDGDNFHLILPQDEGYWVEAGRPDGVLVADREHEIDLITATGYDAEEFTGLNYMKIELDFIVG